MTGRLGGKTAIVTGGTSGIGLKTVELFREEGATVIFTGRNVERGEALAARTSAVFVNADATCAGHAERVLSRANDVSSGVDILVNNAGSPGSAKRLEDVTPDDLEEAVAVHLRSPWLMMAKAAPLMRAAGGGSMINVCSVAGQRVGSPSLTYSVCKAALLHLTRGAAADLGADGIRVNSVSPGFIATPIHTARLDVESKRADKIAAGMARYFMARQALPRTGEAIDAAQAILFLASDESAFVTGTDIVVDGGLMWGQRGFA